MKQLKSVGLTPRWPARETLRVFTLSAFLFLVVAVWWIADPNARAQQGGRDELRIELTSSGFTPNEVQHAPGTFAIAVENSALTGEYTLLLKAEDGTVLREFKVQKGSSAWTVTLQSGTYTLTESDHPQWTCRIVVQSP
ncbi:MAG TPA: hypothetical protein VJM12_12570 [Pyrinomonadaceae bacterium]|nr:hypothetical protein [Pyrinomonadaceae bacterium]